MAQGLSTLAVFGEDLSLVPSIHIVLQSPVTAAVGDLVFSAGLCSKRKKNLKKVHLDLCCQHEY